MAEIQKLEQHHLFAWLGIALVPVFVIGSTVLSLAGS